MSDSYPPYQLPTVYEPFRFNNERRVFFFQAVTEAVVRATATAIAANPGIVYVDVRCAKELTDARLDRIEAIFDELIPDDRKIEIVFDADIPEEILRCWLDKIVKEKRLNNRILN